jgi:GTPase
MKFTDQAEIEVRAGKGGDGKLGFRHEKFRAKGGPDGGDGGHGGDVIILADHNLDTLSQFRTRRKIAAEDGSSGADNRKHGKSGEDTIIRVPVGTQVLEGDRLIVDLANLGDQKVVARGGRGGFGNAHFTSSTRQAPRLAERGEPGEVKKLKLELKLVADVGLVGLPNAGKSTLLSVISNARPEIGDYPFTTLTPNLGVVDFEGNGFLVADIPGLIEGASQGKGLGDEFLRHIERTAVILHLIDAHSEDIVHDYQTIQNELKSYEVDLTAKPQIVVLTKTEGVEAKDLKALMKSLSKELPKGHKLFAISAQAHQGLDELLREAAKVVEADRKRRAAEEAAKPKVVISIEDFPKLWKVEREGDGWRVTGGQIESFAARTNWAERDAVERIRDILRKRGVMRELSRQGIERGDMIRIGTNELEWRD